MNPKTVKYVYMLLHADLYSSGEDSAPCDWKSLDKTAVAYYYICGKLW